MLYTKEVRNELYKTIKTMSSTPRMSMDKRMCRLQALGYTLRKCRHNGSRVGDTQIIGGSTKHRGLGAMMDKEIRIAISAPRGRYAFCVILN